MKKWIDFYIFHEKILWGDSFIIFGEPSFEMDSSTISK